MPVRLCFDPDREHLNSEVDLCSYMDTQSRPYTRSKGVAYGGERLRNAVWNPRPRDVFIYKIE